MAATSGQLLASLVHPFCTANTQIHHSSYITVIITNQKVAGTGCSDCFTGSGPLGLALVPRELLVVTAVSQLLDLLDGKREELSFFSSVVQTGQRNYVGNSKELCALWPH